MGELSITAATASNLSNVVTDYSIPELNTDGVQAQDETTYQNQNWSKQWGYFNSVAELKTVIQGKATWIIGKGYETDAETKVILDHLSGAGLDTFLDILWNMEVVKRVGGDAYAEIIKDDDGNFLNLKPLDPGSMRVIYSRKGIIKRYEQINKLPEGKTEVLKFKPNEVFHLCHNRLADQLHGLSDIDAIAKIVLADGESFEDIKKVMHRQAKPMIMFKLGTDDQTKINAFIAKMDAATNKGENIYIPDDENSVSFEVVQVDVSPHTLAWRNELRTIFYRVVNMPLVVFGQAGGTESNSKIEYLCHEQFFKKDQTFLESQIKNQLGLTLKLISPVSLLENLQTDESKDANQGMEIQPNDVTAGRGE
jgi:hypothetical protein